MVGIFQFAMLNNHMVHQVEKQIDYIILIVHALLL